MQATDDYHGADAVGAESAPLAFEELLDASRFDEVRPSFREAYLDAGSRKTCAYDPPEDDREVWDLQRALAICRPLPRALPDPSEPSSLEAFRQNRLNEIAATDNAFSKEVRADERILLLWALAQQSEGATRVPLPIEVVCRIVSFLPRRYVLWSGGRPAETTLGVPWATHLPVPSNAVLDASTRQRSHTYRLTVEPGRASDVRVKRIAFALKEESVSPSWVYRVWLFDARHAVWWCVVQFSWPEGAPRECQVSVPAAPQTGKDVWWCLSIDTQSGADSLQRLRTTFCVVSDKVPLAVVDFKRIVLRVH